MRALRARDRAVRATLERQPSSSRLQQDRRLRANRLALEAVGSVNSVLPAIAAMAGLTSPPYMLFEIVCFDILPVPLVGLVCSTRMVGALYDVVLLYDVLLALRGALVLVE